MSGGKSALKGNLKARPGYDVGYARPPEENRFTKGKSGNPRGRPKGAKNKKPALNAERMKAILMEEAYRDITVRDGDRNVTVPMAQAIIRSMAVNAVKGQHRSQRLFSELLSAIERQDRELHDTWLETAIEYKIEWERELARRARLGITNLPEPLPHPDHVIIDMREGTAKVVGPSTKEEKAECDKWAARKVDFTHELEELAAQLETETDPDIRKVLEEEIDRTQRILEIIEKLLPG